MTVVTVDASKAKKIYKAMLNLCRMSLLGITAMLVLPFVMSGDEDTLKNIPRFWFGGVTVAFLLSIYIEVKFIDKLGEPKRQSESKE